VWLFPITYAVHLAEEHHGGQGFSAWAERELGTILTVREFVVWNAFGLMLVCVGAALVTHHARFRWVEIALSIGILGNVAAHIAATLLTQTYSPGLISGLVIWLPLGAVRLAAAYRFCSGRGRTAGVALGLSAVVITLAVLALQAR